jgi:hypothetical protein
MPVMPLDSSSNTWLICFSYKADGEIKYFRKEFTGTIREALFHEMQLRGLTKDGTDITADES